MNYEAIAVWSQVVSSVLFLVALVWMFNKFLIPVVMAAQTAKNEEIARTELHRDQAKATLETLKLQMGNAERDAASILDRARDQAKHERESAVAETKAAGDRALRNADSELERARAGARDGLRNELAQKALALARSEAAARITPGIGGRLVDRFIDSLEHGALN